MASSDVTGPEMAYPPVADGSPSRAMVALPAYAASAPSYGGFAPRGPEILHGGFNQTWLAHCLRRRWLMALSMGLLFGAIMTGFLLWLFPSVSQVTAYLKVNSDSENAVFDPNNRGTSFQQLEREAQNHLALLKSPMVLGAALAKQDIADLDAVHNQDGEELLWLMDELRVTFPGDGEILEIRYEGEEDAVQMEKIVAAVVNAYQEKVLYEDKVSTAATQQDLSTVLASTKERLQSQLKDLKAKLTTMGVEQEEVQIATLTREITRLEEIIAEAKKELIDIDVLKSLAVQGSKSPAVLQAVIEAELDKDPTMALFKQQLFELNSRLNQRITTARNRADSSIKQLQQTIAQMEQEAKNYRAQTEKEIRDKFAKMPNESLRAAIVEHDIRYKATSESLKENQQNLEEAKVKLAAMGVKDPDIEMLETNIENEQELIRSLGLKVSEWEVIRQAREQGGNKASDLESVSIVQPAQGLPNVNTIERFTIAGIGGVAMFALTCYGIALLEFRHRRLNGPTDMDEGLGIRVLGVLPPTSLKALAGNSLVATQVAESIDNVRATLMHDSTSAPRQVVMCTSSGSQEGTSVVASSLALSLSRAGRRTLLVDGDLRVPAIHKLFGMALEDGLSEVLRSEIDLSDAVRPTNNEGLYLLTAGVCSAESIHALATDQPQAIFEKLRDQFDFIVIDAPPVLGISDSLSLGQYIDGAILTVLRDHSEIHNVHKAVELLRSMGIRLIGAVVNGVPLKADRRVVRLHQASVQRTPRLPATAEG